MARLTSGGGIGVDITMIPNGHIVAGRLHTKAGKIRTVGPALRDAVRDVVIPRIETNFRRKEAADFYRWDDLSTWTPYFPYRRNRPSQQFGPTLQVTRNLSRTATQMNIWEFDNQAGTAFITGLPGAEYGIAQEQGFANALTGTEVPAREFLIISQDDVNDIEMIFVNYLEVRGVDYGGF